MGESDGQPKDADWAATITGVPADTIRALARRMAETRTMVTASWSLQRAHHGEQPYWAVVLLASALGQIGLPGGGFGFGYGSGAGIGDPPLSFAPPAMDGIKNPINVTIPTARISDCLLNPGAPYDFNGKRGNYPDIRLVYWAGGNPFHHHQDTNKLRRAWQRPETVVVHEPWWTATARHADIVLPATTSLERNDIGGARRDKFVIAMQQAVDAGRRGAQRLRHLQRVWRSGSASPRAYTQGRDEMRLAAASLRAVPPQRRRQRRGAAGLRHVLAAPAIWKFRPPATNTCMFGDFRADPDQHKLRTPSGRIELYSEKIAGFGYDDCPPHPTWIEPWEWLGGDGAKTYPLHLVSSQPRDRLHSQMDCGPVSAGGKVAGREAIAINPADAKARGIRDGDVVRVHNSRGACLAGAIVSDTVSAGVVKLSCGAWYDPADGGEQALCLHGNRERAHARPGHLEARAGAELGHRAGRGRALDRAARAGRRVRSAARRAVALKLLPAGRHHADRCRGPARTEAAAVPAGRGRSPAEPQP